MRTAFSKWIFGAAILTARIIGSREVCQAHDEPGAGNQSLSLVETMPTVGTFWSLQLTNYPPYPYDPFPQLQLYTDGTSNYWYDDRDVDYQAFWAQARSNDDGGRRKDDESLPDGNGGTNGSVFAPSIPMPDYTITTNYGDYTNFWLTITNNASNGLVTIMSTLPGLTYEILTNTQLTPTNWVHWQTLFATNSYTAAPPLALDSNQLFFLGVCLSSNLANAIASWDFNQGCTNNTPAVLAAWSFDDPNPWVGSGGQQPLADYGLANPASPWGDALRLDSTNAAKPWARSSSVTNSMNVAPS